MADPVLVLRPQPGADRTAQMLREAGLEPIVHPLFAVQALPWDAPDPAGFDALLMTSANAARLGGPGLARYFPLPLCAVGKATALAARNAGFADVRTGGGDAASTLPLIRASGHVRLLHLAGAETRPYDRLDLAVERIILYRTVPAGDAATLAALLPPSHRFALVHSPRAGERFAELLDPCQRARTTLVTMSSATARACGRAWRSVVVADAPTEAAMIAGLLSLV